MNKTDAASVRAILERHQDVGLHVDHRLWREVDQPGEMFLGSLATREEFLKLVWQSIPDTRPLTPVGEPRTLFDCANRLSAFGWEFQTLVQAGLEWFRRCVDIDTAFDYGKLGLVALTTLNEPETRETPAGNYYIYDGVHKSIVLAKRLLRTEIDYDPVVGDVRLPEGIHTVSGPEPKYSSFIRSAPLAAILDFVQQPIKGNCFSPQSPERPPIVGEKSRLQCAGLNRLEAEDERALRERSSDPLGLESCAATVRDTAKRRQRIGGVGIQLRKDAIRTPTSL